MSVLYIWLSSLTCVSLFNMNTMPSRGPPISVIKRPFSLVAPMKDDKSREEIQMAEDRQASEVSPCSLNT